MASPSPSSTPSIGKQFLKNAAQRKDKFIHFAAMTGILLLSMRSVGQKYRLHNLEEDMAALREEQETLVNRMSNLKSDLLHEATQEPTGLFASRLRRLFGDQQ